MPNIRKTHDRPCPVNCRRSTPSAPSRRRAATSAPEAAADFRYPLAGPAPVRLQGPAPADRGPGHHLPRPRRLRARGRGRVRSFGGGRPAQRRLSAAVRRGADAGMQPAPAQGVRLPKADRGPGALHPAVLIQPAARLAPVAGGRRRADPGGRRRHHLRQRRPGLPGGHRRPGSGDRPARSDRGRAAGRAPGRPLPLTVPTQGAYYLAFHPHRPKAPRVAAFEAWLAEEARRSDIGQAG